MAAFSQHMAVDGDSALVEETTGVKDDRNLVQTIDVPSDGPIVEEIGESEAGYLGDVDVVSPDAFEEADSESDGLSTGSASPHSNETGDSELDISQRMTHLTCRTRGRQRCTPRSTQSGLHGRTLDAPTRAKRRTYSRSFAEHEHSSVAPTMRKRLRKDHDVEWSITSEQSARSSPARSRSYSPVSPERPPFRNASKSEDCPKHTVAGGDVVMNEA